MNQILEDFAKNYKLLTGEDILFNANNLDNIFKISPLDILLNRLEPSGVNIRLASNMFEILGKNFINEVQYQFQDVNLNGKLLVFMAHADFDTISINLEDHKIYFAMQGEEYKLLCDDLVVLFKFFNHLCEKILENNKANILSIAEKYLEDNKFYNIKDFMYFFFE